MTKHTLSAMLAATLLFAVQSTQADIMFLFQETGGTVTMTSSGTLDTTNLLSVSRSDGWSGVGTENNPTPGDIDIMGGTSFGSIDTQFEFHAGTDFSAITNPGGPFAFSDFSAMVSSGSESFTTYSGFDMSGFRVPGIGVVGSDIVGGLWTPDQMWTYFPGATFAALGLNLGTYSVVDSVTGETITIQIGGMTSVPEGGTTLLMLGLALCSFAFLRRSVRMA